MRRFALILCFTVAACASDSLEVFGHRWTVPLSSDWKIEMQEGVPALRLMQGREPAPGPRRPQQFAIADIPPRARVTVEADAMPLGKSLMIVFAYRDEAHFNYAHLSIDTGVQESHHNGVFHVFGGERVRISSERGPASFPANNRWYHVKLDYDASTGRVGVTVDGHAVPALDAVDLSLGAGKVGVGSFDETAAFKNVRITFSGS